MKTNVKNCERCGEDHENLELYEFTKPIKFIMTYMIVINYWTMCPKLNEPILVAVTTDDNEI
jgi:hypothetical protein